MPIIETTSDEPTKPTDDADSSRAKREAATADALAKAKAMVQAENAKQEALKAAEPKTDPDAVKTEEKPDLKQEVVKPDPGRLDDASADPVVGVKAEPGKKKRGRDEEDTVGASLLPDAKRVDSKGGIVEAKVESMQA